MNLKIISFKPLDYEDLFFEENSVNSFNFDFSTSGMRPAVKMGGTRVQEL